MGSRHLTRVLLEAVEVTPTDDGIMLTFSLPKGAFVTGVLREVMKVEVDEPLEQESF